MQAVPGLNVASCGCAKRGATHQANNNAVRSQPPSPEYFNNQLSIVELVASLKEIIASECTDEKGNIDSRGKYSFAKAIKLLDKRDVVGIVSEKGPIVKAQWK